MRIDLSHALRAHLARRLRADDGAELSYAIPDEVGVDLADAAAYRDFERVVASLLGPSSRAKALLTLGVNAVTVVVTLD